MPIFLNHWVSKATDSPVLTLLTVSCRHLMLRCVKSLLQMYLFSLEGRMPPPLPIFSASLKPT